MLRDKNLIPLSHQHQRALALCVRIDRASPIPANHLPAWQSELTQLFDSEIAVHFAAEESVLFVPAERFAELHALVADLRADHVWLRDQFKQARSGTPDAGSIRDLSQRLSAHIRKEERQLFEGMQKLMSAQELSALGTRLEDALKEATRVCALPAVKARF